jgi:hypothetical protein
MLDTIEPGVLNELMAAERLDPEPAERLVETLKLGFAFMANVLAHTDTVSPSDFEPYAERRKDEQEPGGSESALDASPDQAAMFAATMLGPPTNKRGGMQWPRPSAT